MFQDDAVARLPFSNQLHPLSPADRNEAADLGRHPETDPRVKVALDFIESNPMHLVTIDSAAASVCLSPSRFRHLFKTHTRVSFHQHLMRVRLARARNLIRSTDHPVGYIGQLVGRSDVSHFTRDYKRVYGTTPGADRRGSMKQGLAGRLAERQYGA